MSILPESAEIAAASLQAARSCVGGRQLQRGDLELPSELYLTTQDDADLKNEIPRPLGTTSLAKQRINSYLTCDSAQFQNRRLMEGFG
jgi:hypothetical protein